MFASLTENYRLTRALQICIVLVTTLAIQRLLHYLHAGWIGFSVMMIYAGFDPGSTLHRSLHRFWGAMLGLLLSFLLWSVIRIHYEIITLVIPIIVFMAFFSLGKLYATPTIFTVTLTALGTDYYPSDTYGVGEFFYDYARSTATALGICVFFEYFIFKNYKLSTQVYFDLQQTLVSQLERLFALVKTQPLRQSHYLKLSTQLQGNIQQLQAFLVGVKHDYHMQQHVLDERDDFDKLVQITYQNIRQLFVSGTQNQALLLANTQGSLDSLVRMSQGQA